MKQAGMWCAMFVMVLVSLPVSAAAKKTKSPAKAPAAAVVPVAPPAAPASEPAASPTLTQQTATAEGVVVSREATRVQITKHDGSSWTFVVDPKSTKMDAIAVGDAIQVEFNALMRNGKPEGPAYASRITKRSSGKSQATASAAVTKEVPPPAAASTPAASTPDSSSYPATGGYDTSGTSKYKY